MDKRDTLKAIRILLRALGLALLSQFVLVGGAYASGSPAQGPVTAIDVAIEPDATMMDRAAADNARLLANYPNGFALDETHHAHVTMLQRFVRTADLDKVYAAVAGVLAREKPASWKLKGVKYYFIPAGPIGLAGIVVEPTPDLLRFQEQLIDAVAPYTVKTGTVAAFFTTPAEPNVGQATIDYVAAYVPDYSGRSSTRT